MWNHMAYPFLLFPGLDSTQLVLFEVVQTLFDFFMFLGFSYLSLSVFSKWKHANFLNRQDTRHELKKLAKIVLEIEIGNVIVAFTWYILVLGALVGIVVLLILFFGVPFSIIYMHYYKKGSFSEVMVILLYICTVIPALAASMALTSGLFTIAGVKNYFIFSF